jgi:protein TonB
MPPLPAGLSRLLARLPRKFDLTTALTLSLALHAVALAIHFEVPHKLANAKDHMLEVILVNAKSSAPPREAQARAQANVDGGGNTDENRILKTPLPTSHTVQTGQDLSSTQQKVAELEALQQKLLTQLRSRQNVTPHDQPPTPEPAVQPPINGTDLAMNAMNMARLQGQIDRQTDAYNKRPRKKFIGARTTEYRFAQYEEDWRQKIERVGNLNYPAAARGRHYGTLVLTVEIKSDGTLASLQIDRSSGNKVLDDAARRIVQMAAPYPAFPPNLADTDIISITRTWSFTNQDRLQAN